MTPLGPRAFAKNQDGFSLRFFSTFGAGGFNPCIETDFSTPMEQALLTPVFASITASEKRNIPCTKGAGWKSSFREAQHFVEKDIF